MCGILALHNQVGTSHTSTDGRLTPGFQIRFSRICFDDVRNRIASPSSLVGLRLPQLDQQSFYTPVLGKDLYNLLY